MGTPFTNFGQAAPVDMAGFQPRFIFESELERFGLPSATDQPNIMNLVDNASTLIDETCGRTDGDGHGSLAYTTYAERILLTESRNILRLSYRPLVVIAPTTVSDLAASGENYYTGCSASTVVSQQTMDLSALLGASGRYGYTRRSSQNAYPDLSYMANVMAIASYYGGPPPWTPIDVSLCDYDPRTSELWVPAGLYLSQYSEVVVVYNSGYDPRKMPTAIKHACADIVKNYLAMAGGVGNLRSLSAGSGLSMSFGDDVVDANVRRKLAPFSTVVGL